MQDRIITIEALDMEARGVGHLSTDDDNDGKVIFVEGALPGEVVSFSPYKKKSRWEVATMTVIHKESSQRAKPKCRYFGICGGCSMQHLDPAAQVAIKQRVLEDNLEHIGKVKPLMMMRPIYGPTWQYRYRARLSVHYVAKKGGVLIGFNERRSRFVTDMVSCEILPQHLSNLLAPMRQLLNAISIRDRIPQIEVAIGEAEKGKITVLVLRVMAPLTGEDEARLRAFADEHGINWWLQTKGPETAEPFYPPGNELQYLLPEFGIKMPFKPTDFTQVNHFINRLLVARGVRMLDIQPGERIADLFCGLGNFTLPIATKAAKVVGIEGSQALCERAEQNAVVNGVSEKTRFLTKNLFEISTSDLIEMGKFDRMLVDPPRDGALALCEAIAGLKDAYAYLKPKRIVYVSCSPSTLARDAGILVHEAGYVLSKAGVVNMFPHTSHVESMAVFDLA